MKQKNVILMVVAVGCGLVAAFLTSYAKTKPVEQVEVIVAAKDLSVGTVFTANDMNTLVKRKSVPKDGLPPVYVTSFDELLDKRLSRPMRAEEALNPNDLNKGMSLPDGRDLVSLPIGAGSAASGFVPPGSRIDVIASVKLGSTTKVFKLLVNTLIVNANQDTTSNNKSGAYADLNQVGLALTEKEALALELARIRGCTLTIKLRNATKSVEDDKDYDIEKVLKLLEDAQNPTQVVTTGTNEEKPKPDPVKPVAPVVEMVDVLVAKRFVEPNTAITTDLIAEAFESQKKRKEDVTDAVTDFTNATGLAFKSGVAKGQWVTNEMIGRPVPKPSPVDPFMAPKQPEPEPKVETPPAKVEPKVETPPKIEPKVEVAPAKRKFVDIKVHRTSGTVIWRYEELPSGKLQKIAELTAEEAAQADRAEADKPKAPLTGKPE